MTTTMTPRPVCLLDIDGVLNVFGQLGLVNHDENLIEGTYTQYFDEEKTEPFRTFHLLWRNDLPEMIKKLSTRYDLVWATTWMDEANVEWLHRIGLTEELPVIHFDKSGALAGLGNKNWKTPNVNKWLLENYGSDVRGVWFDDDVIPEDNAEYLPEGLQVVECDPYVGLTPEMVDAVLK